MEQKTKLMALGALATAAFASVMLAGPPAAPQVSVDEVNPGTSVERDLCLSVSLAPGAASECGDLRLAHALPAVRTLNQARAPVLIYNSQHASPKPIVAAHVTLPDGAGGLSRVVATLKVNGTPRGQGVWKGSAWPGSGPVRIAVAYDAASDPTGPYRYTLEVRAHYGADTVSATARGQLVVVNRRDSPFGAGWWLAGLERLVLDPSGKPLLWVGGDGSTRRYTFRGDSMWGAPSLDRPDSIVQTATGWARLLPGRVRVEFDTAGRHVATVNRLKRRTEFLYDTQGRVDTVTVPLGARGFAFVYGADGRLERAESPGLGTAPRVTKIHQSGLRVDSITDPDTTRIRFAYTDPARALVPTSRRNRLNVPTHFRFDAAGRIAGARIDPTDTTTIVTTLRAAESLGLAVGGAGALDTARAYALIDGPRTDVGDSTRLWLDRWGAPRRIADAQQHQTVFTRGDFRFPAVVTRTRAANGLEQAAWYNARGHVDSSTVFSPYGDARNATTRYAYQDADWPDFATWVRLPEGEVTQLAYDRAGNRVSQEDGRGGASRVVFNFNTGGQLTSVQTPTQRAAGTRDSVEYDPGSGNLHATRSPLGAHTEYMQDGLGRDTLVLTAIDASRRSRQRFMYDPAGRVRRTETIGPATEFVARDGTTTDVPASTLVVETRYDGEGRTLRVERWSEADVAGVGRIATRWAYDAAGRKVVEIAPDATPADTADNPRDSTFYDPAGNVTSVWTRRGARLRMAYDAQNRLLSRVVPQVSYRDTTVQVASFNIPEANWRFPLFGSAADGTASVRNTGAALGLVIGAHTESFTYDEMGNQLTADNQDARVRRSYYPNGALATDSLRVRTYTGADFDTHVYGLRNQYDLNGRRKQLSHPAGLMEFANTEVVFRYDSNTGKLEGIDDGNPYGYEYDLDGRVERVSRPGLVEQFAYDADGRLERRWEARATGGAPVHADTFTYDLRGKILRVGARAENARNEYSGLGALVWSYQDRYFQDVNQEEAYTPDALGNTSYARHTYVNRFTDNPQSDATSRRYEQGTGRLLSAQLVDAAGQAVQRNPPDGSFYDASGNRVLYGANRTVSYAVSAGGVADLVERTLHYYGADERLRVVDRRTCAFGYRDGKHQCFPPSQSARPTFEEYRYDALGRRVLVRTRQAWACGNNCVDAALRTVWDGDRELHEIRAPATALEQDEGPVPAGTPFPRQYGRVAYLHGAALDRPLAIYRLHYDTIFPDALHLVPHANWHGDFDGGLYNGEPAPPCRTFRKNPVDHEPAPGVEIPGDAVVPVEMDTVCMEVQWPAAYLWMNGRTRQDNPAGAPSWMGSLIAGRRDATGQVYLRNRYYDPLTGRFTQEDPIGLAGGINLYGFADGDPVGYSDPYGLSPTDDYYYNTRGSVIRVNKTVTEDRHYMVANDGKPNQIVIELDGRPIAGSTPYRFINDPSALDREAKFLGSSEDDTYRNPLEFARQSRNHGGDLDFKPDLNRRWGVRTLWNAGGGLYVHNDKVGNAAWGYYTAHRTMFRRISR